MRMKEAARPRVVDGGWLPFSPISIIQSTAGSIDGFDPRDGDRRLTSDRALQENGDYTSYLVDKDGNEYEPYSLAWRYLGMYLDCDVDKEEDRRNLENRDGGNCDRVLLWAAVSDICRDVRQNGDFSNIRFDRLTLY
jgi:hypothetical protein